MALGPHTSQSRYCYVVNYTYNITSIFLWNWLWIPHSYAQMSFNFTGSTGRRNINLGNRSLTGKNKNAFLKATQLERLKRETERNRLNAAITIQSAIRRAYDLRLWREQLASSWNGHSFTEFRYFFPYLINVQSELKSIQILNKVDENLNNYNNDELKSLVIMLQDCFIEIPLLSEDRIALLMKIIILIVKASEKSSIVAITSSSYDNHRFSNRLISLYVDHKQKLALYCIFKLSQHMVLKSQLDTFPYSVITLLDNWNLDYIKDALDEGWEEELAVFQVLLFLNLSQLFYRSKDSFELNMKFQILYNCSYSLQNLLWIHEGNIDFFINLLLSLVTFVMNDIFGELEYDEEMGGDLLNTSEMMITTIHGELFAALEFFYSSPIIENHCKNKALNDVSIQYVAALLAFSANFSHNHPNKLKNLVDLNWILQEKNSSFVAKCYSNILLYSEDFVDLNTISNESLLQIFRIEDDLLIFDSLFIFAEFLMNMILLSSDDNFYSNIKISQRELIQFIKFNNLFIREILFKFRDIAKDFPQSKITSLTVRFIKIVSLNHALYMKNLKIKLIKDENFWIIPNFDLEFNSMASVIPIVDRFHNSSSLEREPGEMQSLSFLLKPELINSTGSSLPKKVVDFLYILTYAPYMISFEQRAEIFHLLIENDKEKNNVDGWYPTKVEGVVSRDHILFDSYRHFGSLSGKDFKLPFSVQFINQFGELEAGIDGGGLTKELLTALVSSVFIPSDENRRLNKGLQFFRQGTDYRLYCSPELFFKHEYEFQHQNEKIEYPVNENQYLDIVRFLGMILGKCIYDNVLLDVSFASVFLVFWSSIGTRKFRNFMGDWVDYNNYSANSFDELKSIDEALYNSLNYVMKQTDPAKFEQMDLEFVVDDYFYDENLQKYHVTVPLLPYQQEDENSPLGPVRVTAENKMQFVRLVTLFRLSKQSERVMKAFVEGLFKVVTPYWLLLFNPFELQTLISGNDDDVDIDDLQANVQYGGGYMAHDQTIVDLFDILREFDNETRGKFLKFVTSSSKQPLLGFKELNPKFGINKASPDLDRLPTASTCVNLLKLPDYRDKEVLRKKLLYSINSKAGFDLS